MHHANEVLLTTQPEKKILEKIRSLPPEMVAAVEQFIDSLGGAGAGSGLSNRISKSHPADPFTHIWDNPADAEYDSI